MMINLRNPAMFSLGLLAIIMLFSCNESTTNKSADSSQEKDSSVVANKALSLTAAISLQNVKGGFDLMAIDSAGQRLFLAAEDNHSVEVIDIKNNKPVSSLPGFNEPKWIVYRPESNRLYVATGADGKVKRKGNIEEWHIESDGINAKDLEKEYKITIKGYPDTFSFFVYKKFKPFDNEDFEADDDGRIDILLIKMYELNVKSNGHAYEDFVIERVKKVKGGEEWILGS